MLKSTSSMTELLHLFDELRIINSERKKLNEAISQFHIQEKVLMEKSVGLESQIRNIVYEETHE